MVAAISGQLLAVSYPLFRGVPAAMRAHFFLRNEYRMARMGFYNSTELDDDRLRALCEDGLSGWAPGDFVVRVRYSRGADYSGTCFYRDRRVYINLGRHLSYPYRMKTYLARARTVGRYWFKPLHTLELSDAYQVVLFVFLHELYHLLVRKARRNMRQKESMCDRFAARHLVDRFGATVRDARGRPVPRSEWDFQDVDGFVASVKIRSPGQTKRKMHPPRRVTARNLDADPPVASGQSAEANQMAVGSQWLLFPA